MNIEFLFSFIADAFFRAAINLLPDIPKIVGEFFILLLHVYFHEVCR